MPLYESECQDCGIVWDFFAEVDQRHRSPKCRVCSGKTKLIISACAGVVRFPAAGGHEYASPVTGKPITTERARREDLKRTGSRPYEGFEQESKEAKRIRDYAEKKSDVKLHDSVSRAYHQLSPAKRKVLGG